MDKLPDIAKQLIREIHRPYFGDMPSIFQERDWVKDPQYMRNKGIGRLTVNLTPDEYYQLSTEGFNYGREGKLLKVSDLYKQRDDKTTRQLINKLRFNVDSIDRPSLRYSYDYRYNHPSFTQEGLHRMQAGKRLGIKLIPTEVFYDLDMADSIANKFKPYMGRNIPRTYRIPSLPTLGKFGLNVAQRVAVPLAILDGLTSPVSNDIEGMNNYNAVRGLPLQGGIKYYDD